MSDLPDRFPRGWFVLGHQRDFPVGETKTIFGFNSKISILRNNMKLLDEEKNEIGFITSGTFSPILKTSIGLGYIEVKKQNEKLFSLIRNEMVEIEIAKLPFISHKYKKG